MSAAMVVEVKLLQRSDNARSCYWPGGCTGQVPAKACWCRGPAIGWCVCTDGGVSKMSLGNFWALEVCTQESCCWSNDSLRGSRGCNSNGLSGFMSSALKWQWLERMCGAQGGLKQLLALREVGSRGCWFAMAMVPFVSGLLL